MIQPPTSHAGCRETQTGNIPHVAQSSGIVAQSEQPGIWLHRAWTVGRGFSCDETGSFMVKNCCSAGIARTNSTI